VEVGYTNGLAVRADAVGSIGHPVAFVDQLVRLVLGSHPVGW